VAALLFVPIIVPLLTAAVLMVLPVRLARQRLIASGALSVTLCYAVLLLWSLWPQGVAVLPIGSWPTRLGITLVADLFGAVMLLVAQLLGLAVLIYSNHSLDDRREAFYYYPLCLVLMAGVSMAFLTGDLFNLFVSFEVMLIASYVLMALGGERKQLAGAVKYVTINILASSLFLCGVGLLYGMTGTVNMAELALRLAPVRAPEVVTAVAMLLLVAFAIKAALFPVFGWLPASYPIIPTAVTALFGGLLTKVGVYAIVRVFTLIFVGEPTFTQPLLLVVAALTMVFGGIGAIIPYDIKRILSFNIVGHVGNMVMGLGLGTALGLAGSVFYIAHHMVVIAALFLVAGSIERLGGTSDLRRLGGLAARAPLVAVLFLAAGLSLAGLPPLSGFFAKLALIEAGVARGSYGIVAISLIMSIFTLYSVLKIWNGAFWGSAPDAEHSAASSRGVPAAMLVPTAVLVLLSLTMGLGAGPTYQVAAAAAQQLIDPRVYIGAVQQADEALSGAVGEP
jgi:multicomponent Na+:H+ antiporter subunit D